MARDALHGANSVRLQATCGRLPTAPRDPPPNALAWLGAFGNLLRKTAFCSASGKEAHEFVRQPRQLVAVGFPGGGGQLEQ